MIEWRDVPGYEGLYQVSNTGLVLSLPTDRHRGVVLMPAPDKDGYKRVKLTKGCVKQTFSVHRLVALAFIPNPDLKQEVNHIDGNKANNSVSNLEWATREENERHSRKTGLNASSPCSFARSVAAKNRSKPVVCDDGRVFENARRAGEALGVNPNSVSRIYACCKGKAKTAYGHSWAYA